MKKTSLARRNALLSAANVSWGARALVLVLVIAAIRVLAPGVFWSAVAPAYRGADVLGAVSHSFFASFADASVLALENEELKRDNAILAGQNQMLEQEVADLRALGGVSGKGGDVTAEVVARPPESPYDVLVIAFDGTTGAAAGDEVFGPGGVPVGVVSSVKDRFARVLLFSAPGVTVVGRVGTSNTPITLVGNGAGTFIATVVRAAGVQEGDSIFAPGPVAPPVGTVVQVESDPSSPSVVLHIKPSTNPFALAWVNVRPAPPSFANAIAVATSTAP